MKEVKYSIFFVLLLALISISCSKVSDESDDDGITVNDLVGDWNFQSLTFNGVVYDTEAELAELDLTYSYIQLSFLNVTTTTIGFLDHRGSGNPADGEYTLSNNTINFEDDKLVFYIDNWETFDGSVLKLKLLSSTVTNEAPINGVYIMIR
jgi:uncharacterized membrane protein YciS (DUF1049 family)